MTDVVGRIAFNHGTPITTVREAAMDIPAPMDGRAYESAQSANSRQVGGDHYKTGGTEHWDLFGSQYLIGCATKYVSRWRKKNGVQDLEKALHYAEKLRELRTTRAGDPGAWVLDQDVFNAWACNLKLDWPDRQVILMLLSGDVTGSISGIEWLIATAPRGAELLRALVEKREAFDPSKAQDRSRENADESHHSSLYPWRLSTKNWDDTPEARRGHLVPFYTKRGDYLYLDAFVQNCKMPTEIQHCYIMQVGNMHGSWLIRMQDVPADLRDVYPRLKLEVNAVEHAQLPAWQQARYVWHNEKFCLTDAALAAGWGPED